MRYLIGLFLCLFTSFACQATHIRCGHISLHKVTALTYTVRLMIYTNTGSEIRFGDGTLDFGDGSNPLVTPSIDNTKRPDLGSNVGQVVYSINHTFPTEGNYKVTYVENNLDAGIVNVLNSVETKFYLESSVFVNENIDASSPELLLEPNFRHTLDQEYLYSSVAIDEHDYNLTYELVAPLTPESTNFSMPENIKVNYYNGLVSWDAKYKGVNQVGEYLFAVRINQYNNDGKRMGYVVQTFQVILEDVNSSIEITNPVTDINGKIMVETNQKKVFRVVLDNTSQSSSWEVSYDKKINNNISFSQYDSTSGLKKLKVGLLQLTSTSDIIRDNPYAITLRASSAFLGEVFSKDVSYLFFTRDIPLNVVTEVIESEAKEVEVYPNPFLNNLNVKFKTDNSTIHASLLNSAGQIVWEAKINQGESIDTSHLPVGLYILRINEDQRLYNKKVMKK